VLNYGENINTKTEAIMALFPEAFAHTLKHEGGYSNDVDDAGGETYKGISRKYHPAWQGWKIIDGAKNLSTFPDCIENDSELNIIVMSFYKEYYWDRFLGDLIIDQDLANELFDTAVNMGVGRAVTFLQTGLNLLNRNQLNYPDIVEDGKFGQATMNALNSYFFMDDASYLLKIINILQGAHYINYMKKSQVQEKFARGWLKRVNISK
jgi:lysozyme family protein